MLYSVFFILMCGILVWVTIRKKDLFPFSWYPMYSGSYRAGQVRILRIALQDRAGGVNWWKTKYYRYPEFIARKLDKLMQTAVDHPAGIGINILEQKRVLAEVLRLIEQEEGSVKNYVGFQIIERRMSDHFQIYDVVLKSFLFNEIRHGMVY